MNNKMDMSAKPFKVVWGVIKSTFKRLWLLYVLLAAAAVALTFLELMPPVLLKRILDDYLKNGQTNMVWTAAMLYLLASIGSSTVSFVQTYVTTYLGQNILIELRLLMASHLVKLPMSFYGKTPVGEIMSRMTSDVDSVNSLFSSGLIKAFTDILKVFGIVSAMYIISPILCLIALAAIPVVFLTANYFITNMRKSQVMVRQKVGRINTYLQELFNGVRIIKSYGKEEQYEKRFQAPLNEHLKSINMAAVYDSYFPCVMQIIRAITIASVVWIGAKLSPLDNIAITIGSLAAMTDLIGRLLGPIEALSQEFQTIQQAAAGLRRISEFLSQDVEHKGEMQYLNLNTFESIQGVDIEINNIEFGYDSAKPILKGVSLKIKCGTKAAVVGRTGAGKTTLLNLTAGLYPAWKGQISIGGIDPYRLNPSDRRKLIGIVPQQVSLFEGTVKENITLRDDSITMEQIENASKLVGLHDFIEDLSDGYDTLLGSSGIKLSFGQSQLLSLARAIVCNPPLLLLDEPTSGVDALTEEKIFNAFKAVGENRTIITISHRLSGIINADEVYIMASGRIVQSGSPQKLAGEKGWYSVFKQLEDLGWRMDD